MVINIFLPPSSNHTQCTALRTALISSEEKIYFKEKKVGFAVLLLSSTSSSSSSSCYYYIYIITLFFGGTQSKFLCNVQRDELICASILYI